MNKYEKLKGLFYKDRAIWEKTYEERLNSSSTLLFNILDDNIPFFMMLTSDIVNKIEKIYRLDKELILKMDELPPIALKQYTKKCLVDEIKMTNAIEGVRSTRREIIDIIDTIDVKKKVRLQGLVKKYVMLNTSKEFKLESCNDIRDIYDELVLDEVAAENKDHIPDGVVFRNDTVQIQGNSDKILHRGVIDENHIIRAMDKTIDIINNNDCSKLINIAVTHYLIGYIHPFYDGNGRLMRYISSSLLAQILEEIVGYRLSYIIKQNVDVYMKLFKETNEPSNRRDLTMFTSKFLEFIVIAINDLNENLDEKIVQLDFYNTKMNKIIYEDTSDTKVGKIAFILIQNALFGESGLDINELVEISNAGISKVRSIVKYLDSRDLIIKSKIGNKYKYSLNLENIDI